MEDLKDRRLVKSIPKGVYNIPQPLIDLANEKGLEAISTGGNMDYIYKDLGDERYFVLMDKTDPSCVSENHNDPCQVGMFFDKGWGSFVLFNFNTVIEAMDFMAKPDRLGDVELDGF